MLYTIRQLVAGRPDPVCVPRTLPVKEALDVMIQHDFSQLPVIDQHGMFLGLLSERDLLRTLYHLNNSQILDTLKVGQCLTPVEPLTPDSDLFKALDRLEREFAIVVVDEGKPIGILTDYDTTHFFREVTEGLIFIQDIELTLRKYIERAFPDESALNTALITAFGVDRRDGSKPAKQYNDLTLGDHIQLIVTEQNWVKFQPGFESKVLFSGWLDPVRKIRNQLSHFRGQVSKTQLDILQRALNWINNCPELPSTQVAKLERFLTPVAPNGSPTKKQGKYEPLREWLLHYDPQAKDVRLTFQGIEALLGEALPPSAREQQNWWANDRVGHRQSIAWLGAGWRREDLDLANEQVTFHRVADVEDEEDQL